MEKKKFFNTRALVTASLFIALSIVFARMFSIRISEGLRLSFGQTPIILAGILLGPIWGLLVGVLADVAGFLIAPMGAYIPGLTLVSGLIGFIPGLFRKYIFKDNLTPAVIVPVTINMLLVNGLLATYFLAMVYSKRTFAAWFASRIWVEIIMIAVQSVLCIILARVLYAQVFTQKSTIPTDASDDAQNLEE